MTKKNKLYKHHKAKGYFYLKDFSFAIIALLGMGAAVTIPTYIASHKTEEVSIKADSENNQTNENNDSIEEQEEDEELLEY